MKAFIQIDDISLTDDTKRSFPVKPVSKFYCRCISCICCCHYKLIIYTYIQTVYFVRACLLEGEGAQIGEVTPLGGLKNNLLYMQSYNPAIPGCTFSRLLNGR